MNYQGIALKVILCKYREPPGNMTIRHNKLIYDRISTQINALTNTPMNQRLKKTSNKKQSNTVLIPTQRVMLLPLP